MEGDDRISTTAYAPSVQTQTTTTTSTTLPSAAEVVLESFVETQRKFTNGKTNGGKNDKEVRLFPDLHTHLIGMGDAAFWEKIMRDVIPNILVSAHKGDHSRIDFVEGGESAAICSFAKLDELNTALRAETKPAFYTELEKHKKDMVPSMPFTFDVVYSVQSLCKAIGRTEPMVKKETPSEEELLEMRGWVLKTLSSANSRDNPLTTTITKLFRWFLVFNARRQRFEKRFGITNTSLVNRFFSDAKNRGALRSFFETNNSHDNRSSPHLHQQRNALKHDMISQYPIVLDVLLRCVLNTYADTGVNYVEFSIGFEDLVERPWMFLHLSPRAVQEPLHFGNWSIPVLHRRVTYRYLAAFNRREVDKLCRLKTDSDADFVASSAIFFFQHDETTATCSVKPEYFRKHRDRLEVLKQRFKESRSHSGENGVVRPLHDMCVGLDYFGHELYHPHCSFALDVFVNFLLKERERRDGRFGFRIHVGDFFHLKDLRESLMDVHMGVVAMAICRILARYEKEGLLNPTATNCPPPIRIGHGSEFLRYLNQDLNCIPVLTANSSALAKLRNSILKALKKLRQLRIPIEVSPSSVEHIERTTAPLGNRLNPVSDLLQHEFRVVVCTDNEYVCPSALGHRQCLAAELIRASRQLQGFEAKSLLENYTHAAFGMREEVLPHRRVNDKRTSARAVQTDGESVSCFGGVETLRSRVLVSRCFSLCSLTQMCW